MTTELEPISEAVEQKRTIDATLARFSAVHDEMVAEERERRTRRQKLMPWLAKDDEVDEVLSAHQAPPEEADDDADAASEIEPEPKKPQPGSGTVTRLQTKKQRRNGRVALAAKVAASAVAVVILVLTGMGWNAKTNVDHSLQEVLALDTNSPAIQNMQQQSGDENFLLVGTKTRPNAAATDGADTVMVAHVPADRSKIVVVSFPADLEVSRPLCYRWNNQTNSYTAEQLPAADNVRLSTIYADGGPKCLTDTIQDVSTLRINHFVGIDFAGFQAMVNATQGVPMCLKTTMTDSALGTIAANSGQVTLDGQHALNYVRAANISGDTSGEQGRILRQEHFLSAALREVMTNDVLGSPSRLDDFLNAFAKATFADNMGADQLTNFAQSLLGTSLSQINFVIAPTASTLNARGDETPLTAEMNQLFTTIINNSPLSALNFAGGSTQSGGSTAAGGYDQPSSVKLQVLNGGGPAGAATSTTTKLQNYGFQVVSGGNTGAVPKTVIKYSADQLGRARTLQSSVPGADLQEDSTLNGAIELVIGPGFDNTVVAPHDNSATGSTTAAAPGTTGLSIVNAADTSCS